MLLSALPAAPSIRSRPSERAARSAAEEALRAGSASRLTSWGTAAPLATAAAAASASAAAAATASASAAAASASASAASRPRRVFRRTGTRQPTVTFLARAMRVRAPGCGLCSLMRRYCLRLKLDDGEGSAVATYSTAGSFEPKASRGGAAEPGAESGGSSTAAIGRPSESKRWMRPDASAAAPYLGVAEFLDAGRCTDSAAEARGAPSCS